MIGTDGHLSRDCVGQRTWAEVISHDDKVGEDNDDVLARGGDGFAGADAADDQEGENHNEAGGDQIDAAADFVAQDNGGTDSKNLKSIGDQADDERLLDANGLGEDDTIDVEEDDAIDLGGEEGTARKHQLATFDRVADQVQPGGAFLVFLIAVDGFF